MMKHVTTVAKRKAGPGWSPFRFEAVAGGYILTGGQERPIKSGPRKGHPTWDKPHSRVVVGHAELDDEIARYEETTGKCAECLGKRQVSRGWSKAEGNKYKPCPRCGGTGRS